MKPFQVTFTLATPPILSRQTYLDGLLAYCAVKETGGDLGAIDRLPLARHESGVYHASMWFLAHDNQVRVFPDSVTITTVSLRKDIKWMGGYLKKTPPASALEGGSGKYLTYQLRYLRVPANRVVFYGKGDIDACRDLLQNHLVNLGSKDRLGAGRIDRIEAEEIPEDRSLFREGKPVRPLPEEGFSLEEPVGPYRIKPPYWSRRGLRLCYLPATRPA